MKKYQKILLAMLFLVWVCVILFLSGQNGSEAFRLTYNLALPIARCFYENPNNDQILVVMAVMRQAGRCMVFAIFGILFSLCLNTMFWQMKQSKRRLILIGGIILFSVFDEAHKLLIAGRHCTLQEIGLNILSGFAGCIILHYAGKIWKHEKNRKQGRAGDSI